MRFLLCSLCVFFAFFVLSCNNKVQTDYEKIVQLKRVIDSVGLVNYRQPINLRQEALGLIKNYLAAYPNSEFRDSLETLHRSYFDETEHLLTEEAAYSNLKQLVIAPPADKEGVNAALQQFENFITAYPRCPMQNELKDMNLFLQYLASIKYAMPDNLTTLNDLNSYLSQSEVLYSKIISPEFRTPIQQQIQILETRRVQICEREAQEQFERMESEMKSYANGLFKKQCKCLGMPAVLKGWVGVPETNYVRKDNKRSDNADEITLEQVYEYKAPHGLFCRETYLFTVGVKGVVQKSCSTGITYAIEPEILKEPVPIE